MASARASRTSVWLIAFDGSSACGSSIVSISETVSPPPVEICHSSSSAATDEREMAVSESWNSSTVMPISFATSSSVGGRLKRFSRSSMARSISRARERTDRGTQSSERSSSMIEPLMRRSRTSRT